MSATGRLIVGILAGALALSGPLSALAEGARETQIAQRAVKGAPVPFEIELSKLRRERSYLSFNEHIAAVPASRIRDLPVVNGRVGDRVTLSEGHTLHFPLGYLVSATYRFDAQRSISGSPSVNAASELQPNPSYALVRRFDAELGPVCARTEDKASDIKAEFRQRPGQTMAVVLDMPGRFDAVTHEKSRSYVVFVGTEERYIALDQTARRLLAHCRSGSREVGIPFDGPAINIAQLTGVGG